MDPYVGPVVFTEGVHYPVGEDGHGDETRPLRWDADAGAYRDAEPGEPLHNEQNPSVELELDVGAEPEPQ